MTSKSGTLLQYLSVNPYLIIDGLLGATSLHFSLTLVTRNTKYVIGAGVVTFDPWNC